MQRSNADGLKIDSRRRAHVPLGIIFRVEKKIEKMTASQSEHMCRVLLSMAYQTMISVLQESNCAQASVFLYNLSVSAYCPIKLEKAYTQSPYYILNVQADFAVRLACQRGCGSPDNL